MKNFGLTLILLSVSFCSYSQDYPITDSLKNNLASSKTPAEKVKWLGELSSFYRTLNPKLSDGYAKEQLEIAEMSRDRKVMILALLSQANSYYNNGSTQENINKAKKFSQKALDLAKEKQLDEYIAWGYVYLARGGRNEGEYDKALNYNHLAISISSFTENDSLKISALVSLGNTYLARKEKLLAFRSYIQALNLAEESGNVEQLKTCYASMARFYMDLKEYEKAKDYYFKHLTLTRKHRLPYDRLESYTDLGDVYAVAKNIEMATRFYDLAMRLSDTLNFKIYYTNVQGRMIDMYLINNQAAKALKFFNEQTELRDFMKNAGYDYFIDHAYGVAFTDVGKYDSAVYHLKRAEIGFEANANRYNKYFLYTNLGRCYYLAGNYKKSLEYWQKAKVIGEERGDLLLLQNISSNMDSVYQKLGDYKNALLYNAKYHTYKDSLQTMEAERDLLALEVENENKRKQRDAEAAIIATNERHNIQYMGITALIATAFIILVMLGAFSVSKSTIRIMGFFSFIFLFEFIILIADHKIHDATHGEPWKILAIKIVLISMLLPLHHYLEEKVIHLLTERKLIDGTPRNLLNKLTRKKEAVS